MLSSTPIAVEQPASRSGSRHVTVVNSSWKRREGSATARRKRDRAYRTNRRGSRTIGSRHVVWPVTSLLDRMVGEQRTRCQPFTGKRLTFRLTSFSVFCHERSVCCTEKAHALTAKNRSETSDGVELITLVFPPRLGQKARWLPTRIYKNDPERSASQAVSFVGKG
jgi:hypothetical protein